MIKIDIQKTLAQSREKRVDLNFQCEIQESTITALFGESGVGKTSFLRLLSGLVTPDKGFIQVGDETWFDAERKINVPIKDRCLGFLFQDAALLPNMSVIQNLEFAFSNKSDREFLNQLISFMEIEELLERSIYGLSGGQIQRVALARALVQKPRFLFLDEPFSSLDQRMRIHLQKLIKTLQDRLAMTTILISHDITEVVSLADYVVRLENGKVTKQGKTMETLLDSTLSPEVLGAWKTLMIQQSQA